MAHKNKNQIVRMWIARDRRTLELWLYRFKPIKFEGDYYYSDLRKDYVYESSWLHLENTMFPEVTFDNSPLEVEIKLVNSI